MIVLNRLYLEVVNFAVGSQIKIIIMQLFVFLIFFINFLDEFLCVFLDLLPLRF